MASPYRLVLIFVSYLSQAQHYITQLKSQINSLEAELEEQRAQKQRALVENEQLRMELEATRHRSLEHESLQSTFLEAESEATNTSTPTNFPAAAAHYAFDALTLVFSAPFFFCTERSQATEQRYNKLKEKHTELVASHAELLRKVMVH